MQIFNPTSQCQLVPGELPEARTKDAILDNNFFLQTGEVEWAEILRK